MSQFDAFSGRYQQDLDRLLEQVGADTLEFARRKADLLVELAERLVGPASRLSLLDVGCGTGNVSLYAQPRFGATVGCDVAHKLLEEARAKVPAARFVEAEEGNLPFGAGRFDVAFCACVWHHVSDPDLPGLCLELRRVLRPGGMVVIFEHNPYNPITRKIVAECELDRDVERLLPMRQVCDLLSEAGLRSAIRRYTSFFPGFLSWLYPLERYLGWLPLGGQYAVAAIAGP